MAETRPPFHAPGGFPSSRGDTGEAETRPARLPVPAPSPHAPPPPAPPWPATPPVPPVPAQAALPYRQYPPPTPPYGPPPNTPPYGQLYAPQPQNPMYGQQPLPYGQPPYGYVPPLPPRTATFDLTHAIENMRLGDLLAVGGSTLFVLAKFLPFAALQSGRIGFPYAFVLDGWGATNGLWNLLQLVL